MNKEYEALEKLFVSHNEQRMEVKSLPNFSEDTKSNRITAAILRQFEAFKGCIKSARIDVGIEPHYGMQYIYNETAVKPPSIKASIKNVALGITQPPLYPDALKRLNKHTELILDYFNLTPNWWMSIRLAILVHILYLPPKEQPLLLSKPKEPIKYVPIYVTQDISISELKRTIQGLKPQIKTRLEKLPKSPSGRLGDKALDWGQAVSMAGGVLVSSMLTDNYWVHLNDILDKKLRDIGIDDLVVPTANELEKHYKRFMKYSPLPKPSKAFVHPIVKSKQ